MEASLYVHTEVTDSVALLTIDHPPVNALSLQVLTELDRTIDGLVLDTDTRVIVITGGARVFSVGADIAQIKAVLDDIADHKGAVRRFVEYGQTLFSKIAALNKPVVAAIKGFCLGGGFELAAACHIRVCSENARFGQPEINLGLMPGWGGTQRLVRLVGKAKALELMLSGDMLSAQDAYRLGVVNRVVPSSLLLEEAMELARQIAKKPSLSVSAILRAVTAGVGISFEEGLQIEATQFVRLIETADAQEGVEAFLEKRQPRFAGN